jgi:hypothetical protein
MTVFGCDQEIHFFWSQPKTNNYKGWWQTVKRINLLLVLATLLFLVAPVSVSAEEPQGVFKISLKRSSVKYADNMKRVFLTLGRGTGEWLIEAGKTVSFNNSVDSLNENSGYNTVNGTPGAGACDVASMLAYVAGENGLKWSADKNSHPAVAGVPKKYLVTIWKPGTDLRIQNPFDHDVWIKWEIEGDTLSIWVEGLVGSAGKIPKPVKYHLSRFSTTQYGGLVLFLGIAILLVVVGPKPLAYLATKAFRAAAKKRRALKKHWVGAIMGGAIDSILIFTIVYGTILCLSIPPTSYLQLAARFITQPKGIPQFTWSPISIPNGVKFAAVFGIPGRYVGTLGLVSKPEAILAEGKKWATEVSQTTKQTTVPVVVPRLNERFGIKEAEQLVKLSKTSPDPQMVILDVGENLSEANEVAERLTSKGLDGIAIDLEFRSSTTFAEIRQIQQKMVEERQKAGIDGEPTLLLWHVFDNKVKPDNQGVEVPGAKVVVIHDGYGDTASKETALLRTQRLYGLTSEQTGSMAFDNRWPVNSSMQKPSTTNGFDNQTYQRLVEKSHWIFEAAWHAQQ